MLTNEQIIACQGRFDPFYRIWESVNAVTQNEMAVERYGPGTEDNHRAYIARVATALLRIDEAINESTAQDVRY